MATTPAPFDASPFDYAVFDTEAQGFTFYEDPKKVRKYRRARR